MIPELVHKFILAHDMCEWLVFPREDHWFAKNINSGKVYFLV